LADEQNEQQGVGTGNDLIVDARGNAYHTAPGAVASYDPGYRLYYESSIFGVTAQGDIQGTWVNSDGTPIGVIFIIDTDVGVMYLYATGDPAYTALYPEVTLQFS